MHVSFPFLLLQGYMMTISAMEAEYTLTNVLCETFAALLICNDGLPDALDIKYVLNTRLNEENRTDYLHMALSQFCVGMMNHYSQHSMMTTSFFSSTCISGDDNKDKCIQFFDELCTEIFPIHDF